MQGAKGLRVWGLGALTLASALLVLIALSSSAPGPQELVTYDRFGIPEDEGDESQGAKAAQEAEMAKEVKVKQLENEDHIILHNVNDLTQKVDAIASALPRLEKAFGSKGVKEQGSEGSADLKRRKGEKLKQWLGASVQVANSVHAARKRVEDRSKRLGQEVSSLSALESKIGNIVGLLENEQSKIKPRNVEGSSEKSQHEVAQESESKGQKVLRGIMERQKAEGLRKAEEARLVRAIAKVEKEELEHKKEQGAEEPRVQQNGSEGRGVEGPRHANRGRIHIQRGVEGSRGYGAKEGRAGGPGGPGVYGVRERPGGQGAKGLREGPSTTVSSEGQRAQDLIKSQTHLALQRTQERRSIGGTEPSPSASDPKVDIQEPMRRFSHKAPIESVWHVVGETRREPAKAKVSAVAASKVPSPLNQKVAVLQAKVGKLDAEEQNFLDRLTQIKDDKESAKAAVDDTKQTLRIAKDRVVLAQKEFDRDAVGAGQGDVDLDNRSLQDAKHTESIVADHLKDELHQLAVARQRANQGAELARQLHLAREQLKAAMQQQKEQSELRLARGIELKKNFAG